MEDTQRNPGPHVEGSEISIITGGHLKIQLYFLNFGKHSMIRSPQSHLCLPTLFSAHSLRAPRLTSLTLGQQVHLPLSRPSSKEIPSEKSLLTSNALHHYSCLSLTHRLLQLFRHHTRLG
jgi:hypothetical protein